MFYKELPMSIFLCSVDPFTRKDWYDVKAPSAMFTNKQVGKTLVNRTQGTKIASEGLKHRVFEVSLADLQSDQDAERSFRKFRLIAEDVQGHNVLTNFHGMDLTTDKLRSMVKKWQTLIEANVDVKTTDGYLLRLFCIGFTHKDQLSQRKTCYAQHNQVRQIQLGNYPTSLILIGTRLFKGNNRLQLWEEVVEVPIEDGGVNPEKGITKRERSTVLRKREESDQGHHWIDPMRETLGDMMIEDTAEDHTVDHHLPVQETEIIPRKINL
ncbi:40S ribosomal protein S3a isoform X1 [Diaphorina citri]|uniref:Small ribosomal subunit protein eS1 n=1 Tax=Diaphorina citri TaxID=121845 RepID=A0A3Q0J564_DIACI|nr:40S ribosomal protein S3a isoform X1 [Diaphorina citri]